jgi:hypothetical protein
VLLLLQHELSMLLQQLYGCSLIWVVMRVNYSTSCRRSWVGGHTTADFDISTELQLSEKCLSIDVDKLHQSAVDAMQATYGHPVPSSEDQHIFHDFQSNNNHKSRWKVAAGFLAVFTASIAQGGNGLANPPQVSESVVWHN